MFTYRVGWPLWKQIHRLTNCRLSYRYDILKDAETGEYLGTSPDIKGLYAECKTPEEVREVMEYGAADFVREDLCQDRVTLVPVNRDYAVRMVTTHY